MTMMMMMMLIIGLILMVGWPQNRLAPPRTSSDHSWADYYDDDGRHYDDDDDRNYDDIHNDDIQGDHNSWWWRWVWWLGMLGKFDHLSPVSDLGLVWSCLTMSSVEGNMIQPFLSLFFDHLSPLCLTWGRIFDKSLSQTIQVFGVSLFWFHTYYCIAGSGCSWHFEGPLVFPCWHCFHLFNSISSLAMRRAGSSLH